MHIVRALIPLTLLILQGPGTPASLIRGTWRGTSTCVEPAVDRACQDEQVIYQVDSATGPQGPVTLRADKLVNGVPQTMGTFRLSYDSSTRVWFVDFSARLRGRWTFEVQPRLMTGRLTELPSGRVVRRVTVAKVSEDLAGLERMPRRVPTAALEAYSRGLYYQDRGDTSRAARYYEQALEIWPQYTDVCVALHRLRPAEVC